jgi:hypothetical protein
MSDTSDVQKSVDRLKIDMDLRGLGPNTAYTRSPAVPDGFSPTLASYQVISPLRTSKVFCSTSAARVVRRARAT